MNIFDDADDMAWYTSALLSNIVDSHAPVKSKFVKKQSVPYMNSKLRKALYSQNMARNKFRTFGKKFWEENRRQRNRVVSLRKKSIAKYFENKCSKQDKTFWRTISPFFADKKFPNGNHTILREGDNTLVDSDEVAEIFNAYFSSIASEIGFNDEHATPDETISAYYNHPSIVKIRDAYGDNMQPFNFQTVNHDCVARKLQMINIRNATGYDDIPTKLLHLAQNELTHPIANLINNTMAMNTFPFQLKCAEPSLLFKKEDNLNKMNFRPVNILTGISKLYESVYDQLLEYFFRLFNDLIGAYRKGYSCQLLLIKCFDNWKNALDKQLYISALFMDLSKAFDCLPHGLIIAKLHAYGLELSACKLLFSYLCGRKQRVKISTSRSSWAVLTKGVTQCSILGPLLFNILMNDLFLFIEKCRLYNYADDNSLLDSSSENLADVLYNLRHDGRNAIEWFAKNGMQANPDKFHFMLFSPTPTEQQVLQLCDGTSLMSETEVTVTAHQPLL